MEMHELVQNFTEVKGPIYTDPTLAPINLKKWKLPLAEHRHMVCLLNNTIPNVSPFYIFICINCYAACLARNIDGTKPYHR